MQEGILDGVSHGVQCSWDCGHENAGVFFEASEMNVRTLVSCGILVSLLCAGCGVNVTDTAVADSRQSHLPHSKFEYLVCLRQDSRVTWVNGVWTGAKEGEIPEPKDFDSCPHTWEFLNEKGAEGWELVSAIAIIRTIDHVDYESEELYLKRAIP